MNSTLEIDPELTVIDAESARSSRRKRLEPVSLSRPGYNILLGQPLPQRARRRGYGESERQAHDILHALRHQTQIGPSLNSPPFTRLSAQQGVGIVQQAMSQRPAPIWDTLMAIGRR